jgi:hypothetical protein
MPGFLPAAVKDQSMKALQWIWRGAVLLAIIVIGFLLINTVRSSLDAQLQPIQDMSGQVSTQVARVLNPTPTILPDPVTIIHEVRTLARLETIQYTVEKIITAETRQGVFERLVGDRLIFVAHGQVIAGMDLNQLQPDDLQVRDGVLYVRLPAPEIFATVLDNEQSYVYDRETGLFTSGEVDLETEARRAAEREIRESALEDGILEMAGQNAEHFLERLFRDLGFPEVIFESSSE